MKLPKAELTLLQHVMEHGPDCYPYDLVQRSKGVLKLGSIYVLLGRLKEKGLVTRKEFPVENHVLPKRVYTISGLGERVLLEHAATAEGHPGWDKGWAL